MKGRDEREGGKSNQLIGLLRVVIENEVQVNNLPEVESEISYRWVLWAFLLF